MIEDMELAGLAHCTQRAYIKAARQLGAHFDLSPHLLSERQLRDYLIHPRDVRAVVKGTFQQHFGIKFLFVNTLGRDWALLTKKKSVCPIANDFPTCEATSNGPCPLCAVIPPKRSFIRMAPPTSIHPTPNRLPPPPPPPRRFVQ